MRGDGCVRLVRCLDVHFCAGHQTQLPIRHHRFTRFQPAFHHRFTVAGNPNGDRPHLDGLVRLHHVNKLALLPRLHRWRRHNYGMRLRRERHRDLDELSWPQRIVLVGKGGLELDHSRRRIDCVVDERQPALRRSDTHVLKRGFDAKGLFAQLLLDLREELLRHRERDVNGLNLVDRQYRVVRGFDDVARIQEQIAGHALQRRTDGGELDVQLVVRNRGVVAQDRALERVQVRARFVEFVLRDQS